MQRSLDHTALRIVAQQHALPRRAPAAFLGSVTLTILLPVAAVCAGPLDISWFTLDGGGGTSSGGTLSVSGTIGQFDAGGPLTGGTLQVSGGFWPGVPNLCPSDFDGSGFVDTDDFTAFVLAFEEGVDAADFDESGFVDTDDFTAFVLSFESGC